MNADFIRETDPEAALPVSGFSSTTQQLLHQSVIGPPLSPALLGRIDHYDIIRLIGAGGMGLVFLARDTRASLPGVREGRDQNGSEQTLLPDMPEPGLVALKVLKPELMVERRAVAYFLKEARYMQRLDHPHIIKVLAISTDSERPYFVMPYCEGGSLAKLIQQGKALDREFILSVASQVASALAYAHRFGITHRDLKPGNILLDSQQRFCLTDFGLARTLFNDTLIDCRQPHADGTAQYMSPAVAAGEAEGTRSDIYSFGVLLYEMLTGRPPYAGQTREQIINQILAGPPPAVEAVTPKAPRELARICQDAMARDLRDRYASMEHVLSDLEMIKKDEEPLGPHGRMSVKTRFAARMRSHKTWLLFVACCVLTALGIVLYSNNTLFSQRQSLRVVNTFTLSGVWNWAQALVGDLDGDQQPDLVINIKDEVLAVTTQGEFLRRWRIPEADAYLYNVNAVTNLLGDGKDEVLVNWSTGANMTAAVLNQNLFPVRRFVAEGSLKQMPNGAVARSTLLPMAVVDLDQDGAKELIAVMAAGYALNPRGVCCFNFQDSSLIWSRQIGPEIVCDWCNPTMLYADVNGDGFLDIIFGTRSVDNGNKAADGTDDNHAYLYAIAHDGNLLWACELGEYYTSVFPLVVSVKDTNQPQLYAMISIVKFAYEKREVGQIVQISALGEVVASYDAGAGLVSWLSGDLDGDDSPEIYAADQKGRLHILDANLKCQRVIGLFPQAHDVVQIYLVAMVDMDNDGRKEMLLTVSQAKWSSGANTGDLADEAQFFHYYDNKIVVLDSTFKPLAEHVVSVAWTDQTNWSVRLVRPMSAEGYKIISLANEVQVLEFVR